MKISFETISRLTDRDPHSSLHGKSDWATAPPERGPALKRRGATATTFSLRSLALAMLAIAALAGGAVALTRSSRSTAPCRAPNGSAIRPFRDHDWHGGDPVAGSAGVGQPLLRLPSQAGTGAGPNASGAGILG